jgi:hypothetical protein
VVINPNPIPVVPPRWTPISGQPFTMLNGMGPPSLAGMEGYFMRYYGTSIFAPFGYPPYPYGLLTSGPGLVSFSSPYYPFTPYSPAPFVSPGWTPYSGAYPYGWPGH